MNIFQLIADGDVASLMDAVITNDAGLEEQKTVGELIAAFPQYAVSLAEYNVGDIMIPEGFLYSIDPEMYQIVLEQSKDAFRVIAEIMIDESKRPVDRIASAKILIEYGCGKPKEKVESDITINTTSLKDLINFGNTES